MVPVGMIQSDWGGTRIEAWMTVSAARKVLPNILESDPVYDEQNRTARLYNAMICPLTNFTARGFLWYQGEANRGFDGYARYMQELGVALARTVGRCRDAFLFRTARSLYL